MWCFLLFPYTVKGNIQKFQYFVVIWKFSAALFYFFVDFKQKNCLDGTNCLTFNFFSRIRNCSPICNSIQTISLDKNSLSKWAKNARWYLTFDKNTIKIPRITSFPIVALLTDSKSIGLALYNFWNSFRCLHLMNLTLMGR